jgi:hypothetical protein
MLEQMVLPVMELQGQGAGTNGVNGNDDGAGAKGILEQMVLTE